MITKELISKSLDEAIIKCSKPKTWAEVRTPRQIADWFGLTYNGVLDEIPEDSGYYGTHRVGDVVEGKVYSFTDPNNDNLPIYVFTDLVERKTNLLKSRWYETEFPLQSEENEWTDEELQEAIDDTTYPLKQFFQDYMDIPPHIKESIGELVFTLNDGSVNGGSKPIGDGKCIIRLERASIEKAGFSGQIESNPRTTLFHEVSHSFSHKLGYDAKETYDFDVSSSYLANTKEYKKGRREDKKLNGDRYATEYARDSKSFDEEQADIGSAMLVKALSENDSDYGRYVVTLAGDSDRSIDDMISVDDFLVRYPNRVSALNKYMLLDLD